MVFGESFCILRRVAINLVFNWSLTTKIATGEEFYSSIEHGKNGHLHSSKSSQYLVLVLDNSRRLILIHSLIEYQGCQQ